MREHAILKLALDKEKGLINNLAMKWLFGESDHNKIEF